MGTLYNLAVAGRHVVFNGDSGECSTFTECTTAHHPKCKVKLVEATPISSPPVNMTLLSGKVEISTAGCCSANSCVGYYLDTVSRDLKAGDIVSYSYRAERGYDWYEAAIVLYKGAPPATIDSVIADVRVVRGRRIANFKMDNFTISETGNYFVAFYAGSYDETGFRVLGASMEVGEVSVFTP